MPTARTTFPKHYKILIANGGSLTQGGAAVPTESRRAMLATDRSRDSEILHWAWMSDAAQCTSTWQPLSTLSDTGHFSLGRACVRDLAASSDDNYCLIEITHNGWSMSTDWAKGLSGKTGYATILEQVGEAISRLEAAGNTWEYVGLIRNEGYGASGTKALAAEWLAAMAQFLIDIRADLGSASTLPIGICRIADYSDPALLGLEDMRTGIEAMAAGDTCTFMIDTDGVTESGTSDGYAWIDAPDAVHPTMPATAACGVRASKAIQALLGK